MKYLIPGFENASSGEVIRNQYTIILIAQNKYGTDNAYPQRIIRLGVVNTYLEQLEKQAVKTNTLTDELKEWLNWAQHKVNWYDPLINAKDEWLSDEDKNKVFAQEKEIGNSFFNHIQNHRLISPAHGIHEINEP